MDNVQILIKSKFREIDWNLLNYVATDKQYPFHNISFTTYILPKLFCTCCVGESIFIVAPDGL